MPRLSANENIAYSCGAKIGQDCQGYFIVLDMPPRSWLYGARFNRRGQALAGFVDWYQQKVQHEALERAFARDAAKYGKRTP